MNTFSENGNDFNTLFLFLLSTQSHPWGAAASGALGWWPSTGPAFSPPLQGATTPRLPDKEKE